MQVSHAGSDLEFDLQLYMLKFLLLKISAPIRWMVRHELWAHQISFCRNISGERQRRALMETADYVEKHLADVDSFSSPLDLLSEALRHAKVGPGMFLEFGVFSGTTINHIAGRIDGAVYGFDSFEGLPERWRDGMGAGFFKVEALPSVRANVKLVKGWFDQTLPEFLKGHPEKVSFLHVDCDLYSSTKTIFAQLAQRIEVGTIIVFDEYFNYPGWQVGEYLAFQEFIKASGLSYRYLGYNRFSEQVAVIVTDSESKNAFFTTALPGQGVPLEAEHQKPLSLPL